MRGTDQQQGHVFSYISPEQRVRKEHPLRPIRTMVDKVLKELSPEFAKMYSKVGRPSIPPEQLVRALLLQMLYSGAASGCWWRRSTTTFCSAGSWG
jgi:transposase